MTPKLLIEAPFYIICVGKQARMVFRFTFTIFDTNVTEKDDAKATYRSSFSRSLKIQQNTQEVINSNSCRNVEGTSYSNNYLSMKQFNFGFSLQALLIFMRFMRFIYNITIKKIYQNSLKEIFSNSCRNIEVKRYGANYL